MTAQAAAEPGDAREFSLWPAILLATLAGGPMARLPMEPGLPGLVHASMAHVYPDDRGVSKALALGSRAARLAARDATGRV